jgi:hypothetical protein
LRRVASLERIRPAWHTDPFKVWARGLSDDALNHVIDVLDRKCRGESLTPDETAEAATWPESYDDPSLSDEEIAARIEELDRLNESYRRVMEIMRKPGDSDPNFDPNRGEYRRMTTDTVGQETAYGCTSTDARERYSANS